MDPVSQARLSPDSGGRRPPGWLWRWVSVVAFWGALAAVLAVFLWVGGRWFLAGDDARLLFQDNVGRWFPEFVFDYEAVDFAFSHSGLHLRVTDVVVQREERHLLSAASADIWVSENEWHVVVDGPRLEVPLAAISGLTGASPSPTTAAGGVVTMFAEIRDAQWAFPDVSLTLTAFDLVATAGGDSWAVDWSQGDGDGMRGWAAGRFSTGDPVRSTLYVELEDWRPPFAVPADWSGGRATVWAVVGEDSVDAVGGGQWQGAFLSSLAVTVGQGDWQFAGQWRERLSMVTLYAEVDSLRSPSLTVFGPSRLWTEVSVTGGGRPDGVVADFFVEGEAVVVPLLQSVSVAAQMAGDFRWDERAGWQGRVGHLRLRDGEVSLVAEGRFAGRGDEVTVAAVDGGWEALPMTVAYAYVPDGDVREWLRGSLLGGSFDGGFSFRSEVSLTAFAMTMAFSGGALAIDEGWPLAENLDGVFELRDDDIFIRGNGVFGDAEARGVVARIPDVAGDSSTLYLHIDVAGDSLRDYFDTVRRIPVIADEVAEAEGWVDAEEGRGGLSLDIAVPLQRPEATTVDADLSVRDAVVRVRDDVPPLVRVDGWVRIDNGGVAGLLTGELSDDSSGESRLTVDFSESTAVVDGHAPAAVLLSIAQGDFVPVSGEVNFRLERTPTLTLFSAPLAGAVIDLPYPVGKGARTAASVQVRMAGSLTVAVFENADLTVRVRAAAEGVDVAVNDESRSGAVSPYVHGRVDGVNIDLWLNSGVIQGGGDGGVLLTLADSSLMGLPQELLVVESSERIPGAHRLRLNSPAVDGVLTLSPGRVAGHFARLSLATKMSGREAGEGGSVKHLSVSLVADSLRIGEVALGAAELVGEPRGEEWVLSHLRVGSGEVRLTLSGVYEGNHTYLSLALAAPLPELLSVLQMEPVIGRGDISLVGNVAWPGELTDFNLASVEGGVRLWGSEVNYLDAEVDSELVNFLSLFSPQSLFSLGFTKIGEGIIFSRVRGDIRLTDGEAHFSPFTLTSDDLIMTIGGKTNYVYRRNDLHGEVRPGEKLLRAGSTAGLFAIEPTAFVVGTIVSKLLEKPISQIGGYRYTITGSWKEPKFSKISVFEREEEGR